MHRLCMNGGPEVNLGGQKQHRFAMVVGNDTHLRQDQ